MTEGGRSDVFNHLTAIAESLSALAWMAYSGKDCDTHLPAAHVEESWQSAEFYINKVSAPTICINNTGGCQLYLSKDSLDSFISTARSSEISVMISDTGTDSDCDLLQPILTQELSATLAET